MQSPLEPINPFHMEGLSDFSHFGDFHLFIYSRTSTNLPVFLLINSPTTQTLDHISGTFGKNDISVLESVCREFVTKTRGLLSSSNLRFFLAEGSDRLQKDKVAVQSIPLIPGYFSPAIDDICKRLIETPYLFQNKRGTRAYFVKFPILNLKTIRQVALDKGFDLDLRYCTYEEMLQSRPSDALRGCLENASLMNYLEEFLIKHTPIHINGRYAILLCSNYSRTLMFPSLHFSAYKKHGEYWRLYKAYENELPTDEELRQLNGILIPGSPSSVYDKGKPWINKLSECVRNIVNNHQHINLLGVCFGAQLIAQAMGGRVCSMGTFVSRGDTLKTENYFYELEYVKEAGLEQTKSLVIVKIHGDHVVELPKNATLCASSDTTRVEVYTIGKKVLAIQGHPEYNNAFHAGASYQGKDKAEFERFMEEFSQRKYPNGVTQEALLRVCFNFLKKTD